MTGKNFEMNFITKEIEPRSKVAARLFVYLCIRILKQSIMETMRDKVVMITFNL